MDYHCIHCTCHTVGILFVEQVSRFDVLHPTWCFLIAEQTGMLYPWLGGPVSPFLILYQVQLWLTKPEQYQKVNKVYIWLGIQQTQ